MAKKVTKKNTKKTTKSEVLVNCVNIENNNDIYWETIMAKVRNGMPITEDELRMFTEIELGEQAKDLTQAFILGHFLLNSCSECLEKKTPWYKKTWKKFTGLFKKNK